MKFINNFRNRLQIRFFGFKKDTASLTVVGVGPGDPKLLTIAAVNAIKEAKVIVFPLSNEENKSFSAEIVDEYIKFKKKIPIIFPMSRKEFNPNDIWNKAAEMIVKFIKNKESVVLLCLGDTSLFASSTNILKLINNNYPEITTKIIPGISSLSAAAALINFDLASKGETLIIKECPDTQSEFLDLINLNKDNKSVLVLMKVGKRWPLVKDILKKEGILNNSWLALNVGMIDQVVKNASEYDNDMVSYFSLVLLRFKK